MDIALLGSNKRLINELGRLLKTEINCLSVNCYFDKHAFFQRFNHEAIDVLIVEMNERNFKSCFQLSDKVIEKDASIIVIFLCECMLFNWRKKEHTEGVYFLDKKKSYSEMISEASKIMTGKARERCERAPKELLTQREEEVIRLVSQGIRQEQIAINLNISRRTVQNHLAKISEKFGTSSQIESVIRAIELGIIAINYEFSEEF
ncbi:MAG: LuxR C-terminal-related transcriptional regulator [Defluviitaleaceae bacterium]|nr:LuxR C-terminal-related transcriptional regulator [Defluviitaleaceae bacterium]